MHSNSDLNDSVEGYAIADVNAVAMGGLGGGGAGSGASSVYTRVSQLTWPLSVPVENLYLILLDGVCVCVCVYVCVSRRPHLSSQTPNAS